MPKKNISVMMMSLVFIAAIGLGACTGQADEVQAQAQETENVPGNDQRLTEVKHYGRTATEQLEQNDRTIVDLREKAKHKKPQETPGYTAALNILEQKNTDLRNKIKAYRYTSEDKWLAFKTGFSHDMNELALALDELADWWK